MATNDKNFAEHLDQVSIPDLKSGPHLEDVHEAAEKGHAATDK